MSSGEEGEDYGFGKTPEPIAATAKPSAAASTARKQAKATRSFASPEETLTDEFLRKNANLSLEAAMIELTDEENPGVKESMVATLRPFLSEKTTPEGVKKQLRRMVKIGEESTFQLPPETTATATTSTTTTTTTVPKKKLTLPSQKKGKERDPGSGGGLLGGPEHKSQPFAVETEFPVIVALTRIKNDLDVAKTIIDMEAKLIVHITGNPSDPALVKEIGNLRTMLDTNGYNDIATPIISL